MITLEEKTKYLGKPDELLRMVENVQLKDRALWKLVVSQFAEPGIDDADLGWRGEYWGKLMRGACMTWSYTQDKELYEILKESVEELLLTQDEEGRISTYSKSAEFQGWDMWSRKYVLLGLIYFMEICRDNAQKERILMAACRHLDYIIKHVGKEEGKREITDTSHIWGGINSSSILEPVVKMYLLTKKEEYLTFATYIVENGGAKGFDIFQAAYEDQLLPYEYPVVKAYELMSCFEGLIEYYKATKIEKWKIAAENFAKRLLETESTIVGGSGCEHELFNHSSLKQTFGGYRGLMLETCVTITWMKLMYAMYTLNGDVAYLDEIERSGVNALFGSVNTERNTCGPEATFDESYYRQVYDRYSEKQGGKGQIFDSYSPLMADIRGRAVGGFKAMEDKTSFCGCCIAIGAAGMALLPKITAMNTKSGIAVGFYQPGISVISHVADRDFCVKLQTKTNYPVDGKVELTVEAITGKDAGEAFEIALRIPGFAKGSAVSVNDEPPSTAAAGEFVKLSRIWQVGDKIQLNLAMNPRVTFGMHNPEDKESEHRMAVLYGPLVLARDCRISEVGTVLPIKDKNIAIRVMVPEETQVDCLCECEVEVGGQQMKMIDYASAGKTWRRDSEMEAWILTCKQD